MEDQAHTTTGCGKQGFPSAPSAQSYFSHLLNAAEWNLSPLEVAALWVSVAKLQGELVDLGDVDQSAMGQGGHVDGHMGELYNPVGFL
jgi:predicted anti-sigma-YlaC factor YlaD